jgi:DNA (cytosine-5)-methyltransferase 1
LKELSEGFLEVNVGQEVNGLETPVFRFIDLFAGLGGFHVAMENLGGRCVFASELNCGLRRLYNHNFNDGSDFIRGDIHEIETESIPPHDVLCAGFPCQPFSQAGKRFGLDDLKNGNHFYKILEILDYHAPEFFILENVPNLKGHDGGRTWRVIEESLKERYKVQSGILSPDQFGVPQHRKRFYIIGARRDGCGFGDWEFPKPLPVPTNVFNVLSSKCENRGVFLKPETEQQIKIWQEFVKYFHNKGVPKFPIWTTEFGADYPFEEKSPMALGLTRIKGMKGQFGDLIRTFADLPRYATRGESDFPIWKKTYIRRNRELWKCNQSWLAGWLNQIREFDHSHQKFEWNSGDAAPTFHDKIIQFRPSGIRVKNGNTSPALVLAKTQVPIIWDEVVSKYRYISPREAARLQSFGDNHELPQSMNDAYRALGNAVNSVVVAKVFSHAIERFKNRL